MSKKTKITIDSYNKTAEEYYKIVTSFEVLPELEEFMNFLPSKAKILDLGCGPGHHSRIFSEKNFKVTGIDLSPEMINIAKNEVSNAKFEVMDILKLKYSKGGFAGIWASASLLHIQKNHFSTVIKKVHSLLETKGVFYMSLKEGDGEEVIKDIRYGGVDKFYSYFSTNELEIIIKDAGFEILILKTKEKRHIYDTNPWIHIFSKKV